jgi:hypothetical protein
VRFDVVDCTPTAVSLASHFDERPAESRHGLRRFSRGIGGGGGPQPGSVSVGLAFLSLFTEKCHLLIFN